MSMDYGEGSFEDLAINVQKDLMPFKLVYEKYRKDLDDGFTQESVDVEQLIQAMCDSKFPSNMEFNFTSWNAKDEKDNMYRTVNTKDEAISILFEKCELFGNGVYHMFWNVRSMKFFIYFI